MKNYKRAITHGGNFHADDVFSTALMKILIPDIEVSRVIAVPEDIEEDTIVYDIGGGKFDHHQVGSELRPDDRNFSSDDTPYAAFGLLWREFGHELVDEKGWESIDESLVFPIDSHDNGVNMTNSLSILVKHMNPAWNSTKTLQECFDEAVDWAKDILEREIYYCNSAAEAVTIIETSRIPDDPLLVLDRFAPWQETAKTYGIRVCVYPSQRGGWCLQSIDSAEYPLPEEWVEHLPEGMTFCHKNRFLAATKTKEDAINYAREAIAAMES